jgi:hypothetical protein
MQQNNSVLQYVALLPRFEVQDTLKMCSEPCEDAEARD